MQALLACAGIPVGIDASFTGLGGGFLMIPILLLLAKISGRYLGTRRWSA